MTTTPAVSFTVANEAQLNSAIKQIDVGGASSGAGAFTITLQAGLTGASALALTTELEAVNLAKGDSLTINGNGDAIDGGGNQRGLFVYSGAVTVEDLTLQKMTASGGSAMGDGGGGGAGLGGGLFVANDMDGGAASAGHVTLINVNFSDDSATGGNGGGYLTAGVGGGGGLGGDGGVGDIRGGGGGGIGAGANGGSNGGSGGDGIVIGAKGGGSGAGTNGTGGPAAGGAHGGGGGGGGSSPTELGGGGGGVGGLAPGSDSVDGGAGGYGGGGGGGAGGSGDGTGAGGNGGFGGGGGNGVAGGGHATGAHGGDGGFGGGAGSGADTSTGGGRPGFGGGAAGSLGGGGGGLGAGGDIFVQQGASLTIEGGSLSGGTVAAGEGGGGAENGSAFGGGIFLQGDETIALGPAVGVPVTISDVITDQTGSGGVGANAGAGSLTLDGAGTLDLDAANTFTGGVTVDSGTLALGNADGAGSGAITFAKGADGAVKVVNTATLLNTVSGFDVGDRIDFRALAFTVTDYATFVKNGASTGGTVSIDDSAGTVIASFAVTGEFLPSQLSLCDDGTGHLLVRSLAGAAGLDYNGDGTSDVLWQNLPHDQFVDWSLVNGQVQVEHLITPQSPGTAWKLVRIGGDYNGDGTTDLLFQNATTGGLETWDLRNGTLSGKHDIGGEAPSTHWATIAVGDFTGDGTSDILWQNSSTGQVMDWLMRLNQHVSTTTMAGPGAGWKAVATTDLNGDGVADVLWQNSSTHALLDWQMADGEVATTHGYAPPPTDWSFVGQGNLLGGGTDELLFETSTGALRGWTMTNGLHTGGFSLGAVVPSGFAVGPLGDYNGDGVSDVMIFDKATGVVEVGLVGAGGHISGWTPVGSAMSASIWHLVG